VICSLFSESKSHTVQYTTKIEEHYSTQDTAITCNRSGTRIALLSGAYGLFTAIYIREFPSLALLYRKIFFSNFSWSHDHIWRHLCYSSTVNSYTSLQEGCIWLDDETLIFPTCKGTIAKITLGNKPLCITKNIDPSKKPYDEDMLIESSYEDIQYNINDTYMEATSLDVYKPYGITLTSSIDGSLRLFKLKDFYQLKKDIPTEPNNFYKIWNNMEKIEIIDNEW